MLATPLQLKGQLGVLMVLGLDSLGFYPMPVQRFHIIGQRLVNI